jgi:hypothetical protein
MEVVGTDRTSLTGKIHNLWTIVVEAAFWLRRGHLPWMHYRWCPGCIGRQIHNRRVVRKLRRLI